MSKIKAIFLDRDGVINIDKEYLHKIEDFEFVPNIFEVLKYLKSLNFSFFIVTNQSGINRGYYNIDDFNNLTKWMVNKFSENEIIILDVQYCPHVKEDNCNCRKPKTEMFENISEKYYIDIENSWMIGDKKSDIEFGRNSGIKNLIYFNTGKYESVIDDNCYVINSLNEIKEIIC